MRRLALVAMMSCGAPAPVKSPATPPPAPSELSPALAPLGWLVGTWAADDVEVTWVAAAGALYGIDLHPDGSFDLAVIDDGEGTKPADGVLRCIAMPGGDRQEPQPCALHDGRLELGGATFSVSEHSLVVARDGKFARLAAAAPRPVPAIELADRAFSKDAGARGADGWGAGFASDGGMLEKSGLVTGATAVAGEMRELLAAGTLAWDPIASGEHHGTGFTVGKASYTPRDGTPGWRSTYITVWKYEAGAWKVFRDTGRAVNAAP